MQVFFINIFTKSPTYIIFSTNRVLLKKNTYEGILRAPLYVFFK